MNVRPGDVLLFSGQFGVAIIADRTQAVMAPIIERPDSDHAGDVAITDLRDRFSCRRGGLVRVAKMAPVPIAECVVLGRVTDALARAVRGAADRISQNAVIESRWNAAKRHPGRDERSAI